jgi:hypothetical protein
MRAPLLSLISLLALLLPLLAGITAPQSISTAPVVRIGGISTVFQKYKSREIPPIMGKRITARGFRGPRARALKARDTLLVVTAFGAASSCSLDAQCRHVPLELWLLCGI